MHRKQSLRDRLKIGLSLNQFADPHAKLLAVVWPTLSPKPRKIPRRLVLHVAQLRLDSLRAVSMARSSCAASDLQCTGGTSQPHQLRNPPRIVAVAFTGIALKASRTCLVSNSSTARPACRIAA